MPARLGPFADICYGHALRPRGFSLIARGCGAQRAQDAFHEERSLAGAIDERPSEHMGDSRGGATREPEFLAGRGVRTAEQYSTTVAAG